MAWMIYQRYTTAILEAYANDPHVAEHLNHARSHRKWLESLRIDHKAKSPLIEQARVIEHAFEQLAN
jgi:hypothetical protein